MLRLVSTTVALAAAACSERPPEKPWSFDEHMGIVVIGSPAPCLSIANRTLSPGARLQLIPTTSGNGIRRARVVKTEASCMPGVPGVAADTTLAGYEIAVEDDVPSPALLIAVVDTSQKLRTSDGVVVADLDRDGRDDFVRWCTSREGVHATVWSGAPLTGQRRWHRYHYLGYDVDPTCTESEAR